MKIQKINRGCQGGSERRIEVFVKIQKKQGGGRSADVNEKLKFFVKIQRKSGGGGGGVGPGGGCGCERRIEVFVKIKK